MFAVPSAAFAEKRVALVIGNSTYQSAPILENATSDSDAVAALLKSAGFEFVDSRKNLTSTSIRRAIREFTETARDADVAVVYYAGHGIEISGANYLIPTDALELSPKVGDGLIF